MKILFAASEMTPFAKTGGLGDVVGALPIELAELGHEVSCCLPFYRCAKEIAREAKPTGLTFNIPLGGQTVTGELMELGVQAPFGAVRVLFVRRDEYFDRSELYHTGVRDFEDNAERFLFFSKAVIELIGLPQFRPDVVHCHEWQTALIPVLMKYRRERSQAGTPVPPDMQVENQKSQAGTPVPPEIGTKTVFTIHNLAYQGMFPAGTFPLTNLPAEFFTPAGLEFYGQMNLMKGGIVFADAVTTVSPTYAQEIQTPQLGFGLDPVLHSRSPRSERGKADVVGILNGVDYRRWDPATDRLLKQRYNAESLDGKRVCKSDLLRRMNLDVTGRDAYATGHDSKGPSSYAGGYEMRPVAAFISRLTDQKGVDVLAGAMSELLRLGVTVVVLGKGERRYETLLTELAARQPNQVAVKIAMDEELSHQMQAGADLLLVPSKFEPCGLTQLYALKYGTVPVVHDTGGLHDTVTPFDAKTASGHGFRFADYSARALVDAVAEAVEVYRQPQLWQRLQRNAMACDFSWRAAAKQYVKLYESL
jgi:starch synthase